MSIGVVVVPSLMLIAASTFIPMSALMLSMEALASFIFSERLSTVSALSKPHNIAAALSTATPKNNFFFIFSIPFLSIFPSNISEQETLLYSDYSTNKI